MQMYQRQYKVYIEHFGILSKNDKWKSRNLSIHAKLHISHTDKRANGTTHEMKEVIQLHLNITLGKPKGREGGKGDSFVSGQPPNNNPRAGTIVREIFGLTSDNAIEADGNLIPWRGRSSIAGPNRVGEVAELNFQGSYIYYTCMNTSCAHV